MLSDKGIVQALRTGRLTIEGFDESRLTPCAYQPAIGQVWELSPVQRNADPDPTLSNPRYLAAFGKPWDGTYRPSTRYFARTEERFAFRDMPFLLSTKSGKARTGLWPMAIQPDAPLDHLYVRLITCNTTVTIPQSEPLFQLAFPAATLPLDRNGLEALVAAGALRSSHPLSVVQLEPRILGAIPNPRAVGLVLHYGNEAKRYNGAPLVWGQDLSPAFSAVDICSGYELPPDTFALAQAQERITMPLDHVGVFRRYPAHLGHHISDPNSVLNNPGSDNHPVFELFSSSNPIPLRTGAPAACLGIHRLDQLPERKYDGSYRTQTTVALPGP